MHTSETLSQNTLNPTTNQQLQWLEVGYISTNKEQFYYCTAVPWIAILASSHQTLEVEILNIISFPKSSHRRTIKKAIPCTHIPHLIAYMANLYKMTCY